ncbi:uncharacterized protein LOC104881584 [Vitis vinifera]|uniref:uncharacterized protein LOC104881584 n=1 Tax=Vitis vinifera TaxID=29760 RepID=UPI0005403345|nr:uncharacterized protein LOC104881584 [Vitis vinifera]|eukprot:XP_010660459.1 PREDICTED: proline-rich protein 36-like [Vitis vinifera]
MPKTRGGLSASPSSPTPRPHQSTMGGAASPPVQDPAIPPSEGGTPSQCRYPTRRPPTEPMPPADQAKRPASRPPAKRTKFSGTGEPSHAPQAEPPTEDSQIPVGIPPETVIRCPMIAGPPIEGNLDCRDRSFHSETYFDIEILEHLGYPEEPRLERRGHCREDFSLDKWHHLTAYFAPPGAPAELAPHGPPVMPPPPKLPRDQQLPQAQQDEILTDTTPPAPAAHTSVHMPEAIHPTSPLTQGAPPVVPATPAPPPSSEPTLTVSLTEFRGLVSAPSEPLVLDEESLPAEQPISAEEIRAEPSHDPTTS